MVTSLLFLAVSRKLSAESWKGVDVNVVEKFAQEQGKAGLDALYQYRPGGFTAFVFLLAGTAGGFMAGFCWRKLFYPPTSAIVSEANEGGLRRTRRSEAQAGENKR